MKSGPRRTRKRREGAEALDFRQLGFPVSFLVSTNAEDSSIDLVLEAFRHEVLAPNSLECGGGCDRNRFQGFVTRWEGSAGEGDRREVSDWFRLRPEITEYEVGKLVEAWYGV
jgi:uncharacterized protein YggL (DUF469 family)